MIIRVREGYNWETTVPVYDSALQGDPSTPEGAYYAPDFCRDPPNDDRLEIMNRRCYLLGRYPTLPPFETTGEANDWIEFVRDRPGYVKGGYDVLTVPCPFCHRLAGELCMSMNEWEIRRGGNPTLIPHHERRLLFVGRHKRGLIGRSTQNIGIENNF